ncbi:UDP-N-acetylmuramoyl-tripeptide--D-alanyl-D-alanine ligase [Gluconacetobacter azotocaptans]|uniref:UDP-N-acetylmuramoyl-tripeptide--D-alanyl-D- alanine ligase n=1 Tax=Gluconacetobacter azotocaptans TaxID=142834 RepID=UPI00195A2F43|nr:UDP-N-acetylmuramoyl-tripeptide--D-alanyl-D-alanine ligase [Gluconacetobacter azotocaptans]MBM9402396.1 UDP-N-acetylmuramoyl-tripeptide--D-alanyl-D-alanine ligase [Gluconacetobacter azotocaptans]
MTVLWTRDALQAATGGTFAGDTAIAATGVSIDTRTLAPGDLFIALVGEASDGHAHVRTALDKGAAAVLVHDATGIDDPRLLRVADTMTALHDLGRFARARFGGRMIAVTGSVGKTTTKDMLRLALAAIGPTHGAVASYNNHWGVPLTLARLPADAMFCVAEAGMNHPGEIAPLAALIRPEVAIVTTIAGAHLGHMGSLDAIALEKSDLIAALPPGGTAIVPDDATGLPVFAERAAQAGARLWTSGAQPGSDARLSDLRLAADGSDFTVTLSGTMGGRPMPVRLNAPGRHLARNATTALAAVAALGADVARATTALADFRPGSGRGALAPILDGRAALLDESYNASTLSIRASLAVLGLLPAARRVAVLGDIRELGAFARAEHESLLPALLDNADLVFCAGPNMKYLFDLTPPSRRGAWAPDAATLAPLVRDALGQDDVVLVKGSLGSRMRDVVAVLSARGAA